MMGLRPADAAARVQEAGGDAVGANCGAGPDAVSVALQGMRTATILPLIAQANAGIPQVSEGAQHDLGCDTGADGGQGARVRGPGGARGRRLLRHGTGAYRGDRGSLARMMVCIAIKHLEAH